ncbi:primary amine oxidase-like protein [Tanacetum coccineum]
MDARILIRFLFFTCFIVLLLLLSFTNLPYPLSFTNTNTNCSVDSPRCTTIKQPPKPKQPTSNPHTSDVPHHPLDPLTLNELNKVREILLSNTLFRNTDKYALHSVVLEEPDKSVVLRWKYGDELPARKASVIARVNGVTHVLCVDIGMVNLHVKLLVDNN